jgi:hypothetical protein
VGAVIFSFLIGLVLLPLKLGFMLLKGLFVGLLAIPMAAMGFALFVGLMAVGCAIGVVLLILSAVF